MDCHIGRSVTCFLSASRRHTCLVSIILCAVLCARPVVAEQTPQRDPSAISFLSQAVSAAGGATNLTAIQDFTGSGTITHYWGDAPEQGQLTVESRGLTQFRLDSNLPEGTWSFIVNDGAGELVVPSGIVTPIAYQNNVNTGAKVWPILKVNATLQDSTTTVLDMGLVSLGSGQAHQIRIQQNPQSDPTGLLSSLTKIDYFFDPSSLALLQTQDSLYPNNNAVNGAITHTVNLGNYQVVGGLLVPFSITESVANVQTWQIQLSSIIFNTGLSDSDFQF